MGLFDKKYCSICNEKIGLLGNRKLDDGNLCKECANKLSPWFQDRRKSTVDGIKEQLQYRENNKEKLKTLNVTKTLGHDIKVLIDEDSKQFIVTRSRQWMNENPDVLSFSQVTGCILDVSENQRELMQQNSEGKRVSYSPRRFEYEYDFYMIIHVNNPYFDEIKFKLNNSSVIIQPSVSRGFMLTNTSPNVTACPDYMEYYNMGQEIKSSLEKIQQDVRDNIEASNAVKTAVTCPNCGATTIPNANGCCEYCGGAV